MHLSLACWVFWESSAHGVCGEFWLDLFKVLYLNKIAVFLPKNCSNINIENDEMSDDGLVGSSQVGSLRGILTDANNYCSKLGDQLK